MFKERLLFVYEQQSPPGPATTLVSKGHEHALITKLEYSLVQGCSAIGRCYELTFGRLRNAGNFGGGIEVEEAGAERYL